MLTSLAQAQVAFRSAAQASALGAGTATITHVGAGASATRDNCGSITPSIPAGAVDDILVALVNSREFDATVTMAGWNLAYQERHTNRDFVAYIYWRRATSAAANGDPLTITQSGNCDSIAGQIARFAGVDSIQALESDPIPAGNAVIQNSGDIDTGTQTTTTDGSMLLVASFIENDRNVTEGAGWNQSFDSALNISRDLGLALAYQTQATAGAASISNWDIEGNGNDRNFGIIFALRPAVTPPANLVVNVPAGTTIGDVMIANIAVGPCSPANGGACTVTIGAPAGWTQIGITIDQTGGGSFGNRLAVYQRVVTGAEPATYTWSFAGAPPHSGAVGVITTYSGVDPTNPVVAESGQATGAAFTHATPSIDTGAVTDTLLVASHATNSSATWTPPAGMTEVADVASLTPSNNAGISVAVSYELRSAAGTTGTRSATHSNPPVSDTGTTHLLALQPLQVLFSHWRMDQSGGWNGTAGEVIDSGTGGFPGTAAGLTTRPTTSITSPAIAGSPGTCYYGVFNRSNKDYIALPGGYPNLAATAGGFTIAAWINTANNTLPGQRIFIDDQTNASPGGWGFSVGETTAFGAGGLRFYYRQPGVYILDTMPIPSNQWLYVALSVRLVAGANASRATIYAYNTAGALVTSNTGTFTWVAGADGGPTSIGGETNASGEGSNAFGFGGNIDEVRVYQQSLSQSRINAIRQETRPCALLSHIRIEHDGIGLTCAPETVTVKACTDALCTSLYTGSVTTTLSPMGWVGGNTITFTGSTTADLRRTTPGIVTLDAGTTVPAPTSATLCFNGLAQTCDIDFKNSGFLFSAIPTQTAGITSATHTVQAVRTDNNTGACIGVFTGNVPNIELASECVNPATCQAGQQVTFTNNGSGAIAANNSGAVSAWTNRTLTFGADSTANFTFSYPDVGQMRLHARYNIAGSGDYMSGSSSNFVVKPAGFTVTNILRTADSFANPGAADAGGAVFIKAGEAITLTASAVNSLGGATPNYGKETPAEGVRLTSALVPGLGLSNDPGLGNNLIAGGSFNAGSATVTNVNWGEVGIITITPSVGDTDYLGVGDVTGTASGNIGRFTPHHFDVSATAPMFASACTAGGFTYIGQPFSYATGMEPVLTVTARNLAGATTSNYKGTTPVGQAFFKISTASLTGKAYTAASGTIDASAVTAPDPAITDNGDGTGTLTFNSGTGLLFTRTTPVLPFDAEISLAINVIDSDSIAYASNPAQFGQATTGNGIAFSGGKGMRFGRLRVGGTSGSQLLPLRVPFEAQYWTGTFFVTNAADTCTTLLAGNVGLGNFIGNLDAGETTVDAVTNPLQAGRGWITLSAPGAGNNGSVDVAVNLGTGANADACPAFTPTATAGTKNYLRGAWCTPPGTYTKDPAARARFGIRRSSDETIYLRESY